MTAQEATNMLEERIKRHEKALGNPSLLFTLETRKACLTRTTITRNLLETLKSIEIDATKLDIGILIEGLKLKLLA